MGGFLAFGAIEDFKEGWAVIPFSSEKSHYWNEVDTSALPRIHKGERVKAYKALCGFTANTYKGVPALDQGNCPQCKGCQKANKLMTLKSVGGMNNVRGERR